MKQAITIDFSIGDRVVVKDIEAAGIVYAVTISRDGIEYQVKWFSNSDRKSEWFRAEELEAA